MTAYRIVKKIAAGGMAEVFLAKRTGVEGFEKPVAIKRVLPNMAQDRRFIEMFLQEAKLTVSLQHANVVQVLDLGTVAGQYFMVLEFVDGENLRAVLRMAKAQGVVFGLREILFLVGQVAEGLAHAHERKDAQGAPLNIIHRDINPSNVMVSKGGEVKLADFGIARAADFNSGTEAGQVKGKTGYLAPEQIAGAPPDQRSDLFLLGLMLYELLNGGTPLFSGQNFFATLKEIASFDPRALKPLPGVPTPVWAIVTRALARDPAARYQRARDFADAVQGFLFDHRLRVGASDIAALFARVFPDRQSPLECEPGGPVQEIRLEPAAVTREASPASQSHSNPSGPRTVPASRAPGQVLAQVPVQRMVGRRESSNDGLPPQLTAPVPTPTPSQPGSRSGSTPAPTTPTASSSSRSLPPGMRLGELLVARGRVTQMQVDLALAESKKTGARLGEVMTAHGFCTEDDIIRTVGEQRRMPFILGEKLKEMPVPGPDVLRRVPVEVAERLRFVPVGISGRELYVAVEKPQDLARMDAIKFALGMPVKPLLTGESALHMATRRFFHGEEPPFNWGEIDTPEKLAEAGISRYADRHTGTRERMFGEQELELDGDAIAQASQPSVGPEPQRTAVPAQASNGRSVLVVGPDDARRAGVISVLSMGGFSPSAATAQEAVEAVRRGSPEFTLLFAEWVEGAPELAQRLKAAGAQEVRVLESAAEALVGEASTSGGTTKLLGRLLEAAAGALGGPALSAPLFARFASQVARALGASPAEVERAAAGAWAWSLALFLEPVIDARPSPNALRQVLGAEAPQLADLLTACESPRAQPQEGPAVLAIRGASAFIRRLGTGGLSGEQAASALTSLRAEGHLPAAVVESLAAVVSESLLAAGAGATVVLLCAEAATAAGLQTRLMAQGMGVRIAADEKSARTLLDRGASAMIVTHGAAGVDMVALTRSLRAVAGTHSLPIFLVAPAERPQLVDEGLDAGADDVLLQPLNAEVLSAKLRRTLQQRRRQAG